MNQVIKDFLDDGKITQDEYNILFEKKCNYNNCKNRIFYLIIIKIIKLHKEINLKILYLSNIKFSRIYINQECYEKYLIHFKEINLNYCDFCGSVKIIGVDFKNKIYCSYGYFFQNFYLHSCVFKKNISLFWNSFEKNANFIGSKFEMLFLSESSISRTLDLTYIEIKNKLDLTNVSFSKINFINSYINNANLLALHSYNEKFGTKPLEPIHFINKESARLIKAHFEKQNNITEANKYFVIEQEKYIEELKNNENRTDDNRVRKLIPLYFNKIVSHFGTDWVRAILILLLWGIIADNIFLFIKGNNLVFNWKYFGFIVFLALSYLATYTHNAKGKISKELFFGLLLFIYIIFVFNDSLNHIVKLLNPINAFKDDETFEGYEAFGALVRVISATIIYQIIVAFRQFTRRG